jgi:hypothetical protein
LAQAKRSKELLLGVAKSRIYGVSGRDWQARTSVLRIPRRTESTAKIVRDQSTLFQGASPLRRFTYGAGISGIHGGGERSGSP